MDLAAIDDTLIVDSIVDDMVEEQAIESHVVDLTNTPIKMALDNWSKQNPLFATMMRNIILNNPQLSPLSLTFHMEHQITKLKQNICTVGCCCNCGSSRAIITLIDNQPYKSCLADMTKLPQMNGD